MRATRELLALADPPTAIFAQNNRNCIGALGALQAVGRRLAIVGFDDFESATMLPTPVTVVASDPSEMGHQGAELLFQRLNGVSGRQWRDSSQRARARRDGPTRAYDPGLTPSVLPSAFTVGH